MLARLWWKEARQFLPIMAAVALITVFNQWLALRSLAEARDGTLLAITLGMTCLYALVVTAASFAGERENRTLPWLDAQALPRRQLWTGKASFALASTLVLAALLTSLAFAFSSEWKPPSGSTRLGMVLAGAVFLLEVLGWGLFWSALLSNALVAGALSVTSATLIVPYLLGGVDTSFDNPTTLLIRLALAGFTTAASALIVVRGQPPRATPQAPSWNPSALLRRKVSLFPAPRPRTSAVTSRSWRHSAASLLWLSYRQIRSVAWLLAILGLALPAGIHLTQQWDSPGYQSSPWALLLNLVVALVAGVTVFGSENANRGHRILAQHGASAGQIWLVRNVAWLAALALIWLPYLILAFAERSRLGQLQANDREMVWIVPGALAVVFTLGQLCGMTFCRSITAALVAAMAASALAVPFGILTGLHMMPPVAGLFVAAALLAVCRIATGDWLLDRAGPGRWLRLSAWLAAAGGLLFTAYITHRAYSIPRLPAPALSRSLASALTGQPTNPAINAADLYLQAFNQLQKDSGLAPELRGVPLQVLSAFQGKSDAEVDQVAAEWVKANDRALALLREASARPLCQFEPIQKLTLLDRSELHGKLQPLGYLAILSARQHLNAGDLEGAWADVQMTLRMASHWSTLADLAQTSIVLSLERLALATAMQWAVDPGQTVDSLRHALQSYRELVSIAPVADVISLEAVRCQQTLDLPADQLRLELAKLMSGVHSYGYPGLSMQLWASLLSAPWERQRALRVFRLAQTSALAEAEQPPYERSWYHSPGGWSGLEGQLDSGPLSFSPDEIDQAIQTTPLASLLLSPARFLITSADLTEVSRRAFPQIVALRGWQLEHDGHLPDQLAQLVPDWLDSLPTDPFSGQPFRYLPSSGQELPPLSHVYEPYQGIAELDLKPTLGHRLLYSVGLDQINQGATADTMKLGRGDIVFPVPDHDAPKTPTSLPSNPFAPGDSTTPDPLAAPAPDQ